MRILLLTPPFSNLNTPYPATAYLKGFLSTCGIDATQADLGIEVFNRLFSQAGLADVCEALRADRSAAGRPSLEQLCAKFLQANSVQYLETIEPIVRFLQGRDPNLAYRICGRSFLPESPRLMSLRPGSPQYRSSLSAFGEHALHDRAKYLATLFLQDIADGIRQIDPKFQLESYGTDLAETVYTFDPLEAAINSSDTVVDRYIDRVTADQIHRVSPDLVGITIPFPGNVYAAFRIARTIRSISPPTRIVMGGGYVNCELRKLSDSKVFDYTDFITFDDGERPLLCLIEYLRGTRTSDQLVRTLLREEGRLVYKNNPTIKDVPFGDTGTPTYTGLPLGRYLSTIPTPNPLQRLWNDGHWNKLTVAHGCYWKQCTFCDISLDYVGRYEPASADKLVDRIEALIAETGQTGFHFVDEAAPPAVLKALAERLISRGLSISWWGNVRFEKTFTPELTGLLARSGCIAVTGGLEVASDRLLALIRKGVSIDQVARVTQAFRDSGILVHAYLMYGFPSQTEQETVDSLEIVRQLFESGCLRSGAWHRFFASIHSPIGRNPETFGIELTPAATPSRVFAMCDIPFRESVGACDHKLLGRGLKAALQQYMLGEGIDRDVREWFRLPGREAPATTIPPDRIASALRTSSTEPRDRSVADLVLPV